MPSAVLKSSLFTMLPSGRKKTVLVSGVVVTVISTTPWLYSLIWRSCCWREPEISPAFSNSSPTLSILNPDGLN